MLIFALLFCAGFAALAWRRLEWAVLALAFLLPAYLVRFSLVGVPLTLLEAMILIVFAVWFVRNVKSLRSGGARKVYPFRRAIIAWLLVSFAAVGVGGWTLNAFGVWRAYFFEPLLLFIVVVSVFNTREKLNHLFAALGLSAAVVALFAAYQYLTGNLIPNPTWAAAAGRRATSFFPYPNAVGLYAAPIMLILLGALAAAWARTKHFFTLQTWPWLVGIIFCLGAIVMARSEGAAFAAVVCFTIFGLFANRRLRIITLGLIIVGGMVLIMSAPLRTYVMKSVTLQNFSGQVRRVQWKETLIMLRDGRELRGAGLANYQAAVKPYHQEGLFVKNDDPDFQRKVMFDADYRKQVWQPLEIYLYPHNIILNFWSELGAAGVIVFFWLIVLFFYYGIASFWTVARRHDPFAYAILGLTLALVATSIHGLVDVPYFKNDLAALFWIMMAAMAIIRVRSISETKV